jgi:hypothetical protein
VHTAEPATPSTRAKTGLFRSTVQASGKGLGAENGLAADIRLAAGKEKADFIKARGYCENSERKIF